MTNRFQQVLESEPLFLHILAASRWDKQGLRKDQYVSPCLSNDYGHEAALILRIEAEQTRLAYHDPDQEGLKEFYKRNVIRVERDGGSVLFYLGVIRDGYLTITFSDSIRPSELMEAGKRIAKNYEFRIP